MYGCYITLNHFVMYINISELHAVPKLHQLHLLERHGRRVKVIDMVAAEWDSVALRLHFESYDISRIERDHPHQCIQASITLFSEWIEGKGRQPSSWHTLIEALKETRLQSVASDLENIFGMLVLSQNNLYCS